MDIRKATTEDIDAILSITSACTKDLIFKEIFQWNREYPSKEGFENDLSNNWLYVVVENNEIIGSVTITPEMDEEYSSVKWISTTGNNLYIHRLAIDPKMQRRGYAQKLMNFAENYGRINNYGSIRLDTFSKNIRNQKFYEQRGYVRLESVYFPDQSQDPFYCYELIL